MTKHSEAYEGVIYNGNNFEDWMESLVTNLSVKGLVTWLNAELTEAQRVDYAAVKDAARCRGIVLSSVSQYYRKAAWLKPDSKETAKTMLSQISEEAKARAKIVTGQSAKQVFNQTYFVKHDAFPRIIKTLENLVESSKTSNFPINENEICVQITTKLPTTHNWQDLFKHLKFNGDPVLHNWPLLKERMKQHYDVQTAEEAMSKSINSLAEMDVDRTLQCKNCQRSGRKGWKNHTDANCYFPGGGNEGKAPWDLKKVTEAKTEKDKPVNGKLFMARGDQQTYHNDKVEDLFYLDSCASFSVTPRLDLLFDVETVNPPISVATADGRSHVLFYKGTVRFGINKDVPDVYYAPHLDRNLIAMADVEESGCDVNIDRHGKLRIKKNGRTVCTGSRESDRLLRLDLTPVVNSTPASINSLRQLQPSLTLLHQRCGHASEEVLKHLPQNVAGISEIDIEGKLGFCDACAKGKMTRAHNSHQREPTVHKFGLGELHVDISGPHKVRTMDGKRYRQDMVLATGSRFMATRFLAEKHEGTTVVINYINFLERQTGKKVQLLRMDNAEATHELEVFCAQKGIKFQPSNAYEHNDNPSVERAHRTINEMAATFLHDANLPMRYWGFAADHAIYVKNRLPMRVLNYKTPFEALFGTQPSLKYLRRFGSRCFVHIPVEKQTKMGPRSKEAIYLGNTLNGYLVKYVNSGKITRSRSVLFDEAFKRPALSMEDFEDSGSDNNESEYEFSGSDSDASDIAVRPYGRTLNVVSPTSDYASATNDDLDTDADTRSASNQRPILEAARPVETPELTDISDEDFLSVNSELDSAADEDITLRAQPSRSAKTRGIAQRQAILSIGVPRAPDWNLPRNSSDAMAKPGWAESMLEELQAIHDKGCYRMVDTIPVGQKALGTRMIFKIKFNEFNEPYRLKSRLVAQGFRQHPGFDFDSTYAPVVSTIALRALLAITTIKKWRIYQFDVNTAYLNGHLDRPVYVKLPEELRPLLEKIHGTRDISLSWCLLKGLYGLKQAARIWYKTFTDILRKFGLQQSHYEPCLFFGTRGNQQIFLLIHVDDGINFTNSKELYADLISHLAASNIQVNAIGEATKIVGLEIHYNYENQTLGLGQSHYIKDKLTEFGLENATGRNVPTFPVLTLPHPPERGNLFQHLVGSLQFAASQTRPDIAFSVGALARFNTNNNTTHYVAAKGVMRYLKETQHHGLLYKGKNAKMELEVFVDSDFAGDPIDRKSVTGYVIKLAGAPIAWKSQKQTMVTTSTSEAELVALSTVSKNVTWLTLLLKEIGLPVKSPVIIHGDNQQSIGSAVANGVTPRSKHIDVKYFAVREQIELGHQQMDYVPSNLNQADPFTKHLPYQDFKRLREAAGIQDLRNFSSGSVRFYP
jgi:hypothetical protein